MESMHILDLPDDCLIEVLKYLDTLNQCNFAFTCIRFRRVYEIIYGKKFRSFFWCESYLDRSAAQAFFRLNGYKIRMLSVWDEENYSSSSTTFTPHLFTTVCCYLTNVRCLILSLKHELTEVLIQIIKHMQILEHMVVDCVSSCNFEGLALLPRLRSLDIQRLTEPYDKLFQRLSELRPSLMKHLRIGSDIQMEQGRHIAYLQNLTLLNVCNPCIHFFNAVVFQLSNLRVLNVSSGKRLRCEDFLQLVVHLDYLSTLNVNGCADLGDEFVFFIIEHFKKELLLSTNLRRLPFRLELSETGVSPNINEIDPVNCSDHLVKILNLSSIKKSDNTMEE